MVLVDCPECGRCVSDRAVSCPQCGFPVSSHVDQGGSTPSGTAAEDPTTDAVRESRSTREQPESTVEDRKIGHAEPTSDESSATVACHYCERQTEWINSEGAPFCSTCGRTKEAANRDTGSESAREEEDDRTLAWTAGGGAAGFVLGLVLLWGFFLLTVELIGLNPDFIGFGYLTPFLTAAFFGRGMYVASKLPEADSFWRSFSAVMGVFGAKDEE